MGAVTGCCVRQDHLDAEVFDTLRQSENPFLAPMFLLPLTKTGNLTMDQEQAQRQAGAKARTHTPADDSRNKVSHTKRQSQRQFTEDAGSSCLRAQTTGGPSRPSGPASKLCPSH